LQGKSLAFSTAKSGDFAEQPGIILQLNYFVTLQSKDGKSSIISGYSLTNCGALDRDVGRRLSEKSKHYGHG
jgi:hypothetical protein